MNKDFIIEFVRLIPRPIRNKTTLHLCKIVEEGTQIDIQDMFSDAELDKLFMAGLPKNPHMVYVYTYVRDNQEIFISK